MNYLKLGPIGFLLLIIISSCVSLDKGDAVAINENKLKPHELLTKLNNYGFEHGIGREDIVENRFVGMKSRGIYETPGGTILAKAHRAIESITLDRGEAHIKDEIMPKYAETIIMVCGFPLREKQCKN